MAHIERMTPGSGQWGRAEKKARKEAWKGVMCVTRAWRNRMLDLEYARKVVTFAQGRKETIMAKKANDTRQAIVHLNVKFSQNYRFLSTTPNLLSLAWCHNGSKFPDQNIVPRPFVHLRALSISLHMLIGSFTAVQRNCPNISLLRIGFAGKKVPLTITQNRKKPKKPVVSGRLPEVVLGSVRTCYMVGEDLARLGDGLDDAGTVRLMGCTDLVVVEEFKWGRSVHEVAPWTLIEHLKIQSPNLARIHLHIDITTKFPTESLLPISPSSTFSTPTRFIRTTQNLAKRYKNLTDFTLTVDWQSRPIVQDINQFAVGQRRRWMCVFVGKIVREGGNGFRVEVVREDVAESFGGELEVPGGLAQRFTALIERDIHDV